MLPAIARYWAAVASHVSSAVSLSGFSRGMYIRCDVKMKHLFIILFVSLVPTNGVCQTITRIPLSIKNVKKAFNTEQDMCDPPCYPREWVACNDDSSFFKTDTIQLCTHLFEDDCCNRIDWFFHADSTVTLRRSKMCVEPPLAQYIQPHVALRLRYKKEEGLIRMCIYDGVVLKENFLLTALIKFERKHTGENIGYKLTMVRQRNLPAW